MCPSGSQLPPSLSHGSSTISIFKIMTFKSLCDVVSELTKSEVVCVGGLDWELDQLAIGIDILWLHKCEIPWFDSVVGVSLQQITNDLDEASTSQRTKISTNNSVSLIICWMVRIFTYDVTKWCITILKNIKSWNFLDQTSIFWCSPRNSYCWLRACTSSKFYVIVDWSIVEFLSIVIITSYSISIEFFW